MLALEVADLTDLGIDLGTLGFEAAEIDALLRSGAPDAREEETLPRQPSPSLSKATSGCSDRIGSCAAAPPTPPPWRGSWALCGRT
jgi:hypothetical protein